VSCAASMPQLALSSTPSVMVSPDQSAMLSRAESASISRFRIVSYARFVRSCITEQGQPLIATGKDGLPHLERVLRGAEGLVAGGDPLVHDACRRLEEALHRVARLVEPLQRHVVRLVRALLHYATPREEWSEGFARQIQRRTLTHLGRGLGAGARHGRLHIRLHIITAIKSVILGRLSTLSKLSTDRDARARAGDGADGLVDPPHAARHAAGRLLRLLLHPVARVRRARPHRPGSAAYLAL
jgi:hypothetical protein